MFIASKAKFGPHEIQSLCGVSRMGEVFCRLDRRHP
jgi:hypothetical protein